VTTYEFQAPLFYQKLGFRVEYIREDKEPKLNKYFLVKEMH
jgi:ribosomal protein S18 acetylase RimI-like enzyme